MWYTCTSRVEKKQRDQFPSIWDWTRPLCNNCKERNTELANAAQIVVSINQLTPWTHSDGARVAPTPAPTPASGGGQRAVEHWDCKGLGKRDNSV